MTTHSFLEFSSTPYAVKLKFNKEKKKKHMGKIFFMTSTRECSNSSE
jgi:hypothetical protein